MPRRVIFREELDPQIRTAHTFPVRTTWFLLPLLLLSVPVWSQEGTRAGEEREVELAPGVKMVFCWCPPGKFLMGSPKGEKGWADQEDETQHEVILTKGFWIGKYEVTQLQWQAVGRLKNPSYDKGPENPVDGVTWKLLKPFLKKMGKGFRLPTEAEWEYACRAGSTTRFCFGDDETQLVDYAWCGKDNQMKTHPVGQKKPNAWGIHDMHGNVWEWCADWYADYPKEAVTDPIGPRVGERRVVRGGYWGSLARECRCAKRRALNPAAQETLQGFRVVADSIPSLPPGKASG